VPRQVLPTKADTPLGSGAANQARRGTIALKHCSVDALRFASLGVIANWPALERAFF
jgi:hypothetical protein